MSVNDSVPLAAEALVTEILATCGTGRILAAGHDGVLLRTMLRAGADAYGLQPSAAPMAAALPGRSLSGDMRRLPFRDDAFDVIVANDCLRAFDARGLAAALAELHRVARRAVFLRVAPRGSEEGPRSAAPKSEWESRLFAVGFRKHPAYYEVNDYESLDAEEDGFDLVMEKIPMAAARAYPVEALAAERDLHMDMTRESGARSDAHIMRYQLAARYVRPGDTVLDAACGLGYGAYLLHTRTMARRTLGVDASEYGIGYAARNFGSAVSGLEFRVGELPGCLDSIADHSVDFISCFETLEHVPGPAALLQAFARILTPAGRIVASVPNDWSDESGRDPNPFHFHVYDWPRLRDELEQHFIVEAAYEQTASRRKVGTGRRVWEAAGRRLRKVDPASLARGETPDCEWWIAVGMKDPVAGKGVPYRDPAYDQAPPADGWHGNAFARDYVNPWLVRGMVTIGQRLSDDAALLALARRAGQDAPPGSADSGAVMTVEAYRALADPALTPDAVAAIDRRCAAYLAAASPDVPHQQRWTVSILFVLAQLWQAVGLPERAARHFDACAAEDALRFSPLLATKTVEASLRLALLRMARGDAEACRAALRRGMVNAERALRADWSTAIGDREHPVDFGLPELAAVAEQASACAFALSHLDLVPDKPGLWWWQHQRNRISEIERYRRSEASLRAQGQEVRSLYDTLAGKDAALHRQAREIHRLEGIIAGKDAALTQQGSEIHRLDGVVVAKDLAQAAQASEVRRLESVVSAKDGGLAEQASEVRRLESIVSAKDGGLAEQASEIRRLHDGVADKDAALAQLDARLLQALSKVAEQESLAQTLAAENARLAALLEARESSVATHVDTIRSLNVRIAAKERAEIALEAEFARVTMALSDAQSEAAVLRTELGAVEELRRHALLAEDRLRATGAEAQRLETELLAIRNSKWFALGEALRNPLDAAAVRQMVRLSFDMARKRLRRQAAPPAARPSPATTRAKVDPTPPASLAAWQPYVIQRPVPRLAARPRVVHALANFMTGGSSRLVVDLMERLGADYEQRVLTSFVPTPPAYLGAEVAVLPAGAGDEDFVAALRAANPRLVHVHYWGDCDEPWYRHVFAAAEQLGLTVVENVNTPVAPYRSPAVVRYVYVSQYVKDTFGHGPYPEDVVHPGSDLSLFAPADTAAASDTIGMVYRMERDKLDERAIEPFIRAVQRRAGTRALVVGGGGLLDSFKRQAEAAGVAAQFTFTGFVAYEALPALYASMTIFVAPVWKESFGQVSIFAMSMGVPVVGYATGAIPEIVGDDALLAPPGDSEALADVVVHLLDDPAARQAIALRNRERARALYSVESMINRYRDLYASLIGTPT